MNCRIVDLRGKEVINIHDGARLGFPYDVELDQVTGRLVAIIVMGPCKFFGLFGRGDDFVIPWEHIKRIGDDIILVESRGCIPQPPRRRKWWN